MKAKILKRAQSDVSSLFSIEEADLDYYCDEAIKEMTDIVDNKDVDETCKFDIAYFRFLLYVKQDGDLTEAEMKIYEGALKKVDKAKYIETENPTNKSRIGFVGQRQTKWF